MDRLTSSEHFLDISPCSSGRKFSLHKSEVLSVCYINNSRHLARKYARIWAKLEENCELRETDNVQGQISEHIFAPNGGYCLYYPSNLFRNARNFQNWGIFNNYSPKWRWIVVDIHRAAKRRGKHPSLSPTLRWIIVLVYATQAE